MVEYILGIPSDFLITMVGAMVAVVGLLLYFVYYGGKRERPVKVLYFKKNRFFKEYPAREQVIGGDAVEIVGGLRKNKILTSLERIAQPYLNLGGGISQKLVYLAFEGHPATVDIEEVVKKHEEMDLASIRKNLRHEVGQTTRNIWENLIAPHMLTGKQQLMFLLFGGGMGVALILIIFILMGKF